MAHSNEDLRLNEIRSWLEIELHLKIASLEPASSDASFRRYFRVTHQEGQQIVMDAPPDREKIQPFIGVAGLFTNSGIHVPKIFQQNLDQGFLLLEDFGSECFLDKLNTGNADQLYQSALDSLFLLQTGTDIKTCRLPEYDLDLLNKELSIFSEWFIQKFMKVDITVEDQPVLDETWHVLTESALEQPKVCVHRDYHSRNLMFLSSRSPGILDFQDAVVGPITYDLASLLRDCYVSWPENLVQQWSTDYFDRLCQADMIQCSTGQFQRWFDLMGLQRHLKAIGIFARLQLRDGKPDYLRDIPRTMDYVTRICGRYSELSAFNQFLNDRILPVSHLAA